MIHDYKVCCVAVDPAIGESLSELIPGDKCKYASSPPPNSWVQFCSVVPNCTERIGRILWLVDTIGIEYRVSKKYRDFSGISIDPSIGV